MKSLSLKRPFVKVNKFLENVKYEKHQKEVNRLVNIEEVAQPEAYKQLCDAQEMLANYAKANNVSFSFETVPAKAHPRGEQISVFVSNDKTLTLARVNADTNAVEKVQRLRERMLEDKDGLNYINKGIDTCEDTFLRRVYRTVERLTNSITKKEQ